MKPFSNIELGRMIENAEKAVERSAYFPIAKKIQEIRVKEGLAAAARKYLEVQKIKPIYVGEQKGGESFLLGRERLESEAGLIIANHPGLIEIFPILEVVGKRSDIKIVTTRENFKDFSPIIGEENLIPINRGPEDAFEFLSSIEKHIESGGLVIFFLLVALII